jgi:hypothetical protein
MNNCRANLGSALTTTEGAPAGLAGAAHGREGVAGRLVDLADGVGRERAAPACEGVADVAVAAGRLQLLWQLLDVQVIGGRLYRAKANRKMDSRLSKGGGPSETWPLGQAYDDNHGGAH